MDPEIIRQRIDRHFDDAEVLVGGGGGKFEVTVISDRFNGLNPVGRHQAVYAAVNEHIASGAIHALSIKTYTHAEYEAIQPQRINHSTSG